MDTIQDVNALAQTLREQIPAEEIVDILQKFVAGEIELTENQVMAGGFLLDAVLPDLIEVEVKSTVNGLSEEEVKAIAIEYLADQE